MTVEGVGKLRREIDELDDQLVELLMKRMALASDIIGAKKVLHWPVRNMSREREISVSASLLVHKRGVEVLGHRARSGDAYDKMAKLICRVIKEAISASREFGDWNTRDRP